MSRDRQAAERLGRRAEWAAELFLRLKGYTIVARRFRARGGELDLVARRGRLVAFVEVKRRADRDDAVAAVTPRNRRRIEVAAAQFLAARPALAQGEIRYDILAVAGWRLHHLRDAWREGE